MLETVPTAHSVNTTVRETTLEVATDNPSEQVVSGYSSYAISVVTGPSKFNSIF